MHIGACEIQAVSAALAWCHVANVEVKDVKIRPDSGCAIVVLDRSHRVAGANHETVLGESKQQVLCHLQAHEGSRGSMAK